MKEFDDFCRLVDKSLKYDPWVKNTGLIGYINGINEEVDEVKEELKKKDYEHLKEEMGDIIYDWLHACKLAESEGLFHTEDALRCAIEKLKRRKPYLLEDKGVTEKEAVEIWMKAKESERQNRKEENTEYVWFVDEDDKELGSVSRKDSMLRSLWHRSTGIMVINSKGEILVHKRAAKIKFPYYYDMFFGGYVSYGESYDENAKRELFEEAGIVADPVFLFKSKNDDPESRSHFQIYQVKSDGPFRFQEDEVEKGFFVSMEVLKDMVRKEKFTPGSLSAFGTYLKGFYKNGKR